MALWHFVDDDGNWRVVSGTKRVAIRKMLRDMNGSGYTEGRPVLKDVTELFDIERVAVL